MRFRRPRAAGTAACDLVTVETVGLCRLCVVFGIEVERRTVQLAGPPRSRAERGLVIVDGDRVQGQLVLERWVGTAVDFAVSEPPKPSKRVRRNNAR